VIEQVEEGKICYSTFHLEKTDYEPRKPAT